MQILCILFNPLLLFFYFTLDRSGKGILEMFDIFSIT